MSDHEKEVTSIHEQLNRRTYPDEPRAADLGYPDESVEYVLFSEDEITFGLDTIVADAEDAVANVSEYA